MRGTLTVERLIAASPRAARQPRASAIVAVAWAIAVAGLVGACAETRYTSFAEAPPPSDDLATLPRVVAFERDPRLLSERPRCVLVQSASSESVDPQLAAIVEDSLVRYLSRRAASVVAGSYRDRLAREHGLDPSQAPDLPKLARTARCDTVLAVRILDPEALYAVVIATYRLGLELQLVRIADEATLWRARHVTRRSEGGLPLGLSALTSAWSASAFAQDEETVHSLADDIARRLFATWPAARPN